MRAQRDRRLRVGRPARLAWLAAAVCLVGFVLPAKAHGGGVPQLVDVAAGPYRLFCWTKPDPARVGDLHLTVGVFEPAVPGQSDVAVLDAAVSITLSLPSQTAALITESATRENAANKLYYELDVALPAAGEWQVAIGAEGPAGAGESQFVLVVLPPSPINWALVGGSAVVVLAMGWWLWSALSARHASPEQKEVN